MIWKGGRVVKLVGYEEGWSSGLRQSFAKASGVEMSSIRSNRIPSS